MIKRQARIERIGRVLYEYWAAKTAANWLAIETQADPNFGERHGWPARGGVDFVAHLEATYIIRIYAEFEVGLRDYWLTFRKRDSRPKMIQLVNDSIPTVLFPQHTIDAADEVRQYRNFLVHDIEDEPGGDVPVLTIEEVKKRLCAYTACLDPAWR